MPAAPSPLRRIAALLWKIPVISLPFALFFGTLSGGGARSYVVAYELALVFCAVISLGLWLLESFALPALHRRLPAWKPSLLTVGLLYMLASVAGTFAAVFVVRWLVMPDFMTGGRA